MSPKRSWNVWPKARLVWGEFPSPQSPSRPEPLLLPREPACLHPYAQRPLAPSRVSPEESPAPPNPCCVWARIERNTAGGCDIPKQTKKLRRSLGGRVWCLGLGTFTPVAWVQSLAWQLRSHMQMLHTTAIKRKKEKLEVNLAYKHWNLQGNTSKLNQKRTKRYTQWISRNFFRNTKLPLASENWLNMHIIIKGRKNDHLRHRKISWQNSTPQIRKSYVVSTVSELTEVDVVLIAAQPWDLRGGHKGTVIKGFFWGKVFNILKLIVAMGCRTLFLF